MSDGRLVITGTGLTTVFGVGRDATWSAVIEGRCGLEPNQSLKSDDDEIARGEPSVEGDLLAQTAREALEQAGLDDADDRRFGVIMGTTLHGIRGAGRFARTGDAGKLAAVPAPRILADAFASLPGLGCRLTTCAACSSGLTSIAMGATLIRADMLDVAVVGGYDPSAEYAAAGFSSLRLTSPDRVRPFCRDREGLRLGPGYAVLVLERADAAESRGADVLAELLGVGETADAFHLTRPEPHGRGAAEAMRLALVQAGLEPRDIDASCAHATGTPANDAAEYEAMQQVFGDVLPTIPVTAYKSHLGHTLGAAGAVELVLSTLAIRTGRLAPAAGVASDETEFESLDLVTGAARTASIKRTINLSLGFGGANTCVVLGAPGTSTTSPETERFEVALTGVGMLAPCAVGNDAVIERWGPGAQVGAIEPDALASLLTEFRLRRQSEYARMTIAAACLAIENAAIDDRPAFASGCGAILGTAHGSANYSEAYYRELVERGLDAGNPMLFAEGVPNAGAAQLSIALGVTGGCQTIVGSRTAGLEALALAATRTRCGQWRRAIVSAADEFNDAVNAGYESCGLTGAQGGFDPAAGAAAFVLERADDARARGARILATIDAAALSSARSTDAAAFVGAVRHAVADAADHVIGSANNTWIDDVERAGMGSTRTYDGSAHPETFAAGPLLRLGTAVLRPTASAFTSLCVDPLGPVASVNVSVTPS